MYIFVRNIVGYSFRKLSYVFGDWADKLILCPNCGRSAAFGAPCSGQQEKE